MIESGRTITSLHRECGDVAPSYDPYAHVALFIFIPRAAGVDLTHILYVGVLCSHLTWERVP